MVSSQSSKGSVTAEQIALELPALPYPENALEPSISAKTLSFHHDKHHATYVEKTKSLIQGTDLQNASLEEIIRKTAGKSGKDKTLFNNAAQVWNHTFYWRCMKPGGGGQPSGRLAEQINKDFGSLDEFKKEFSDAAVNQFGSGYAWLVMDGDKLKVVSTSNAENPMVEGKTPLLNIDVWEHAYYLDYQNRRADHVKAWLDKLVNWEFAAQNMA